MSLPQIGQAAIIIVLTIISGLADAQGAIHAAKIEREAVGWNILQRRNEKAE